MSVGDVASAARGSGARYNDGKPPLDLIPLRILARAWAPQARSSAQRRALMALESLADFQEAGDADDLYAALAAVGNPFREIARVLEYGKRKYAAWNWAKGMAWSVAISCAARHLEALIVRDEELDDESGLPHVGHFGCNVVFLLTFIRTYPEGDDRPTML